MKDSPYSPLLLPRNTYLKHFLHWKIVLPICMNYILVCRSILRYEYTCIRKYKVCSHDTDNNMNMHMSLTPSLSFSLYLLYVYNRQVSSWWLFITHLQDFFYCKYSIFWSTHNINILNPQPRFYIYLYGCTPFIFN